MSNGVEVEHLDVLQNIESTIVQMDHEQEDLTDYEVGDVLDALIRAYRAEASGYRPPVLRLTPLKLELYERVQTICEWRLGRASLSLIDESGDDLPSDQDGPAALPLTNESDDALPAPLEIAPTEDVASDGEIASIDTVDDDDEVDDEVASIGIEDMVACLKRLRLSVKRWNSQGGRRGYLEFVGQFVPG